MAIKGVFFDFWGTLVENGVFPSPVKQVKYILRLNIPFSEYIQQFEKSFMTKEFESLTDAFNNVCRSFNIRPPQFVIEKLVGMWNKNSLLAKPFPDTVKTLEMLKEKGIKIGLISNTDQFSINQVIDKFDLRKYFDVVVFSYNEGMLKSDKELFDVALDKLKLDKEEVLMVGDSMESDIKGAENAGIKPLLIDRRDKREYENKIITLKDIEKYL